MNGEKIFCNFKNNKANGKGVYFTKNDKQIQGVWKNNIFKWSNCYLFKKSLSIKFFNKLIILDLRFMIKWIDAEIYALMGGRLIKGVD